jgi:uncharacterized membrane protein YeaQ/YmgE (transglycosylase-associated protein family)
MENHMDTLGYTLLIGLYGALVGTLLRKVIKGRNRDLFACTIVAVVGGVTLGALGPSMDITPLASAAAIALSIGIVLISSALARASLRRSVMMAPAIREFALANFDRLAGKDGLISQADLTVILAEDTLSPHEQELADRMSWDLHLIGHVIDSITSISPHSGAVAHLNVYGASRSDLESYPQRVAARYEQRYGSL